MKTSILQDLENVNHKGQWAGIWYARTENPEPPVCPYVMGSFESLAWKTGFRKRSGVTGPIRNIHETPDMQPQNGQAADGAM